MIANSITKMIGEAMKARDEISLSTFRMLSSALNYEKIAKQHDLTELEEIVVVRREVKKRNDMIDSLQSAIGKNTSAGGDAEINSRIERETSEIEVLRQFLPAEMDDDQLLQIIDKAIETTNAKQMTDMGKVMGIVNSQVAGRADGKRISDIVKSKLTLG